MIKLRENPNTGPRIRKKNKDPETESMMKKKSKQRSQISEIKIYTKV